MMSSYKIIFTLLTVVTLSLIIMLVCSSKNINYGISHEPTSNLFKGVSEKKLSIKIDDRDVTIVLLIVNTEKLSTGIGISSPKTIGNDKKNSGYTGLSLKEYAKLGNYQIVQSGGYLSEWSPPYPLGYVKIHGKEYNRVHDSWVTKGTFCTDGHAFEIKKFTNYDQFDNWDNCIQTGPMIIDDHKPVVDKSNNAWPITGDRHRQSFICKNERNEFIMGVAENVKLTSFADFLATPEKDKGLGCVNAVSLTSKGIAGIFINTKTQSTEIGNVDVPLPNAIVIK
jgi:hypothetical protein